MILEMKNISKSYFGIQVLHEVELQLEAGEIHCLVGENGAGKSTVVKILCGMKPDYTGDIVVDGKPVHLTTAQSSRQAGIFSVQQHRDLVPTMNIVENIFLGNYILKKGGSIDMRAMTARAREYLDLFETRIDLEAPVSTLKVSEQGIIAICKAVASEGKVFLIDEASAPLDNFERTRLYSLLRKLRDDGKGIIYISHHLEEIFALGDRVTVLRNGHNVWTKKASDTDREDLINAMTGNKKIYSRPTRDDWKASESPVIYEFDQVRSPDVENVSFRIRSGEVIGFAGLEGFGRQQVANLMFGLEHPSEGRIQYKGEAVDFSHPAQAVQKNIGLVPTERKIQGLVPARSVVENMSLAAVNKVKSPILHRRELRRNALLAVERMSIKLASITQLVEYLSGGNQQKVLLGKWMQTGIDVLLCVEPTEGVDIGARGDIYGIMREMATEGKTIVVFSSDLDELLTLCDRIYTMAHGRIIGEYDAEQVEKTQILSDILTKKPVEKGVAV